MRPHPAFLFVRAKLEVCGVVYFWRCGVNVYLVEYDVFELFNLYGVMGKGRKPMANSLKVLKGTDQPCRMREVVSYDRITKIPAAPGWMCKAGKKAYKIVAGQLAAKGILDVVNVNAVMMYANEMGKYVEAEEELRREGAGIAERVVEERSDKGGVRYVRNPLDKMASEYLANAKMWAVELGITPASSSKVKETVQQGGENPLAELLDMTM